MAHLLGSVGRGGRNDRSDAVTVQNLINLSIRTIVPFNYLQITGECDQPTIEAIMQFQRRVVMLSAPDGRIDPGGRTLLALNLTSTGQQYQPGPYVFGSVGAPASKANGGTGTKYTDNPNEVVTKHTVPAPGDVVAMLRAGWPELEEQGARTLTAQFLHETGGGKYCFNWNLGNVKTRLTTVMHMYLKNVWEGAAPSAAEAQVAGGNGLVRIATADEIKAHGWAVPGGKTVVVFQPPHSACRFRAFPTLAEGATGWTNHHKSVASRYVGYLPAANSGDCAEVAHLLKLDRYYTGNEGVYARSMTSKKAELDRTLGPAS